MENFEMTFDVKKFQFIHEPTGYVLNAEDLFTMEDDLLIAMIYGGTEVKVDDFFIKVLRDTVVPF